MGKTWSKVRSFYSSSTSQTLRPSALVKISWHNGFPKFDSLAHLNAKLFIRYVGIFTFLHLKFFTSKWAQYINNLPLVVPKKLNYDRGQSYKHRCRCRNFIRSLVLELKLLTNHYNLIFPYYLPDTVRLVFF